MSQFHSHVFPFIYETILLYIFCQVDKKIIKNVYEKIGLLSTPLPIKNT